MIYMTPWLTRILRAHAQRCVTHAAGACKHGPVKPRRAARRVMAAGELGEGHACMSFVKHASTAV